MPSKIPRTPSPSKRELRKPPASRTELVQEALRQAIVEQNLLPGTRLPEDTIGESFGTSRTIAREALGRLAVEGLVELKPNRGAFVAHPTLEEGRDVFIVRQGLERTVVELLAGRLTAKDIAHLEALVEAEQEASGQDMARSVRLAGEFHRELALMTGNQLLLRYVTELVSRCSLILAMYSRPHSSECAVNEHTEIVAALAAGDVETAVEIMQRHLRAVSDRALPANRLGRSLREVLAPYVKAAPTDRQNA